MDQIIDPTNISVLSESSVSARIYALMTVLRVVVISLCPNRSITVFGLTPFSARIVPYNKTGLKHSKRLCKGFV